MNSRFFIFLWILLSTTTMVRAQSENKSIEIQKISQSFDYASDFSEGLAAAKRGDHYGYLAKDGKVAIPFQFDDAYSFSEGLAKVKRGNLWGYIKKNGKLVIDYQFESAYSFSDGLARVQVKGKYGFVNKEGVLVIQPVYKNATNFSEGLAAVSTDEKWGFVDKKGKTVIYHYYDDAGAFSEGLAPVKLDEKWGYIDATGKQVIEYRFDKAMTFNEGLAAVEKDNSWGYINRQGTFVISPRFDRGYNFSEGLLRFKENGKWGYIDKSGSVHIQPEYEQASDFREGLAKVRKDDLYGFIDTQGDQLIDFQFPYISSLSEGMARVRENGKYQYVQLERVQDTKRFLAADSIQKENYTPSKPPYLVLQDLQFSDANQNQMIDALETSTIQFTLSNMGYWTAQNIQVRLREKSGIPGLIMPKDMYIEKLEHNQSKAVSLPVKSTDQTADAQAAFMIHILEGNGFDAQPVGLQISTRAYDAPELSIADHQFYTHYGDEIRLGVPITLKLAVQNVGKGKAGDALLEFQLPENVFSAGESTFPLGYMQPGESRIIEYEFFSNKRFDQSAIPLRAILKEETGKHTNETPLQVELDKKYTNVSSIVIKGKDSKTKELIEEVSLTSEVDKDIPVNPQNKKRFALIIGNEDYSSFQNDIQSESNVSYAMNDARIFREYALKTFGVPEENLFYMVNATAGAMKQKIDLMTKLLSKVKNAELIFYYAGHGYPDEVTHVPYLIPVDVSAANLSAAISLKEIYERLSKTGANRISVFLDACFSGGARNSGLIAARGVRIEPREELLQGNIWSFSASSGKQSALPFNKEQHGMFTYFLLKKLQETKGDISYGDLVDEVTKKVSVESLRTNEKEQDPRVNVSQQIEDAWRTWRLK